MVSKSSSSRNNNNDKHAHTHTHTHKQEQRLARWQRGKDTKTRLLPCVIWNLWCNLLRGATLSLVPWATISSVNPVYAHYVAAVFHAGDGRDSHLFFPQQLAIRSHSYSCLELTSAVSSDDSLSFLSFCMLLLQERSHQAAVHQTQIREWVGCAGNSRYPDERRRQQQQEYRWWDMVCEHDLMILLWDQSETWTTTKSWFSRCLVSPSPVALYSCFLPATAFCYDFCITALQCKMDKKVAKERKRLGTASTSFFRPPHCSRCYEHPFYPSYCCCDLLLFQIVFCRCVINQIFCFVCKRYKI